MIRLGRLLAVPTLVILGALSACSGDPERAATVGTASPAAPVAETTKAAPKPKGAGDELSAKQVQTALLTVADMPTGWAAAQPEPDEEDNSTVEPASCQKLFDQMNSTKQDDKAQHKAKASFEQGGLLGLQFEQEVASFTDDGQGDKVQDVAQALTKCPKVVIVDGADRTPMTMLIGPR